MSLTRIQKQIGFIARSVVVLSMLLCACSVAHAGAQIPYFTYQGQLQIDGHPANGSYDLDFSLWNDSTAGTQIGTTIDVPGVAVEGGLFTVGLEFDGAFNGTQAWLQVFVDGVAMAPRTEVATAPVAQYSLSGAIANGSVTRNKLAGARLSPGGGAAISLTNLAAGHCEDLSIGVGGVQVDDIPLLSFGSAASLPQGLIIIPYQVKTAGLVKTRFCNLSSSAISFSNLPVLFQSFR